MCCSINEEATRKWWDKNKHKKRVLVWKVLWRYESELCGEVYYKYEYAPGECVAKSTHEKKLLKPFREVSKRSAIIVIPGIHAFVAKDQVREILGFGNVVRLPYIIVPFWAEPKHMIAVGTRGDIVFTQVTLTKSAHKQALRKTNE